MKNAALTDEAIALTRLFAIGVASVLFFCGLAAADTPAFTLVCEGRETDNSDRLKDPTAKPKKLTFSLQLSFDLAPPAARVFVFDETRWIPLTEASEYRLAFAWHSDFDNVASVDRYTDIYRFTKVTDKDHLRSANDLIMTRMGKCHEIPYVTPPG